MRAVAVGLLVLLQLNVCCFSLSTHHATRWCELDITMKHGEVFIDYGHSYLYHSKILVRLNIELQKRIELALVARSTAQ